MKRALLVAVALAAIVLGAHGVANAQTAIDVTSNSAQSNFPNGVTFQLAASSDTSIDDVRLVYTITSDGVRNTGVPQCSGTKSVRCTFELSGGRGEQLIPGADITYFWTMTAGGQTEETEQQTVSYVDSRFEWRTLSEGNMTLWYYDTSDDDAQDVLDAAYDSMQQSSALLETTVDYPVKVFLYATADDMELAILSDNEEGVVTLGEVVYSDTAMVAADSAPDEIARHEIAHIVQRAALTGAYRPPDWVLEGMAVYMQSVPLSGQRDAIESAIEHNDVFSVRSMSSASSGAISGNVFLFYGEAWSLVDFLVEQYGQAKFAAYFRAVDGGAGDAGALEQVYGFNQDGLENAWRASVGLPPREAPTPDENSNVEPTVDSIDAPAQSTEDDTNVALIVGIIAVTGAIAASMILIGVMLARRFS